MPSLTKSRRALGPAAVTDGSVEAVNLNSAVRVALRTSR